MTLRTYIIEDSPTIRQNLIETLHELSHVEAVGTADTEGEGVRWLTGQDHPWDLAIVDLFLREGSGMNVLAACSARREEQMVVVLTNHATDEIRRRCAALGADAVFDKSTQIDDLIDFCEAVNSRLEPHH